MSPIILVVFVITSCTPPFRVDIIDQEDYANISGGQIKGTPRVAFLDADYHPTTKDTGKMAMIVENNEQVQGVLVLAEIRDDHYDNDIAVRILSREDGFFLSLFYHSGDDFPYKLAMSARGEDITGRFSPYDAASQTYSVELFGDEGESRLFNGLILNKGVFDFYEPDRALTSTQNARLDKIIISLALYSSMAIQINENSGVGVHRGAFIDFFNFLGSTIVFAFTSLIIGIAPKTIPTLGPIVSNTLPVVILETISTAIAVNMFTSFTIDLNVMIGNVLHNLPLSALNLRPKVEVGYKGSLKKNMNAKKPYYLEQNQQMTFDITFPYLPDGDLRTILENPDELAIYTYDPRGKEVVHKDQENGRFFDITTKKTGDTEFQVTIGRNSRGGVLDEGEVWFFIMFSVDVIINGMEEGVEFKPLPTEDAAMHKNFYIFCFTVDSDAESEVIHDE